MVRIDPCEGFTLAVPSG
jgi:hypothetical protein